MKQQFELLREYKHLLTKQQYRTFKGQILSGDVNGAIIGLKRKQLI